MKIIILGGYGIFGGRLCQLLAQNDRLTMFVAGRSYEAAKKFCARLDSVNPPIPLAFDRDTTGDDLFEKIHPDLFIDASGPFQNYGTDPYRLAKLCIRYGVHYMDFADGSEFVNGIRQFDEQAKQRGVFVLSGVSSFPVLTAAVMRHLSPQWQAIHSIKAGIAPSPFAVVGMNVIKAIASYAGKPVSLMRNGRPPQGYALTESLRYTISPPGRLPLNTLRFSLVDVPDLKVLPTEWPEAETVWMGAGPTPEILLRMLNGFAWLVRLRILPSLQFLAPVFYFVINNLRWGEHRGGMFVDIEGLNQEGNKVHKSWHMVAIGEDGPFIPCMALEAAILRMLNGQTPIPGARAATHELELSDYLPLFERRAIYTGVREDLANQPPLPVFRKALGNAWGELPVAIQHMHDAPSGSRFTGIAHVQRGKNLLSRLIAALFRFPDEGKDIPVEVAINKTGNSETWERNFNGKRFTSHLSNGTGNFSHLLCERFGFFTFGIALVIEEEKLKYIVRKWRFLNIPLPNCLLPKGECFESSEDGQFNFDIEISYAWIGLIVRYQGWLRLKAASNQ